MRGPQGAVPCPIQFCVLYVGDLAKHLLLHHHFEKGDVRKIVNLNTISPRERVRVQKCPEADCQRATLEETLQEHLELWHFYTPSQSAIVSLALNAVPAVPPTLTIEDSSSDDDDDEEECIPALSPAKKITLKTALEDLLKGDDVMENSGDVESKSPKTINNYCKSPEIADEIPSLGSFGDAEDDDVVMMMEEEDDVKEEEKEVEKKLKRRAVVRRRGRR